MCVTETHDMTLAIKSQYNNNIVLQVFSYFEAFESNTTSRLVEYTLSSIRSCAAIKLKTLGEKDKEYT